MRKEILVNQELVRATEQVTPKPLNRIFIKAIFVITQAKPQFPNECITEQKHSPRALSWPSGQSVKLNVQERRMFIDPIQVT